MTLRLADVVFPPALPHVRSARDAAIRKLTAAVVIGAGVFVGSSALLAWTALNALGRADWLVLALALLGWAGVYMAVGAGLFAAFVRRLRLWSPATLEAVASAKAGFVTGWPVAAPRLLWLLVEHRAVGGGSLSEREEIA